MKNLLITLCFFTLACSTSYGKEKETTIKPTQKTLPNIALPNIIVIFCDDMGYADISPFGADKKLTPHLNKMAQEGMKFTNFYATHSACTRSRASLLTGCYPDRLSIGGNFRPTSKTGLNPNEITIAEVVKQKNYATAAFGKWHLGHLKKFLPLNQGFDEFYGFPYSHDMWPHHPEPQHTFPPLPLYDGNKIVNANVKPKDQLLLTNNLTKRAIQFIEKNQKQPFLIYLPYPLPHVPLFVSKKFNGKTKQGLYADVISELDANIGTVFDTLKKCKIDENTLVIFTSDNGPWLMYGNHGGSAKPLRAGKGTVFEGGYRVPCIMRWPAKIPKNTVNKNMCAIIDILPTIAHITQSSAPKNKIDGKNILPLMTQKKGKNVSPHTAFFYGQTAVRSGQWKLHLPHRSKYYPSPGKDGLPGKRTFKDIPLSLFNLETDIGETKNVAADNPKIVSRLKKQLSDFTQEIKANKRAIGKK